MLQQILKDMFIDPEILEELSDDQKQILFFKMREEQIRRWNIEEAKRLEEEKRKPLVKKQSAKNVRFYCDNDLNLIIDYIKEPDEEDLQKKQEEEALKKAEEQARKEAEQKRKELEAIEAKYREELKRKEEAERVKKEIERKKEEERRKTEEAAAILKALQETKLQKQKEESEKRLFEERNRIKEEERRREEEERRREEAKRKKEEEEENRLKIELEKKKREEALVEEERKRKEEIYKSMKIEQEERRKQEEEESKQLDDEWKEREKKAKEADKQRRNSFSYSKNEFERMRKLAREKAELAKLRKPEFQLSESSSTSENTPAKKSVTTTPNVSSTATLPTTVTKNGTAKNSSTPSSVPPTAKGRSLPFKRPPLPTRPDHLRPTISTPVKVTSTRDEVDTIPVKKELVRPSRPPPAPCRDTSVANSEGSSSVQKEDVCRKDSKQNRPPRPKSKNEVIAWYKEVEFSKLSGLDMDKKPMDWFHGVISRPESERLLSNKKQGSYLVRLSERVWGYTISYKDIGRCKHFLIDTIHGGYQFFGMEQIVHNSLNELIEYHKKNPISGLGEEVLVYPCGQEKTPPDYEHLLADSTQI